MAEPASFFFFFYVSDPGIPKDDPGTALPEPALASACAGPSLVCFRSTAYAFAH